MAAFAAYMFGVLGLLFAGVVYTLRREFMPYHKEAAGTEWSELPGRSRALILAMLHEIGAAEIACAFATLMILCVPFRRQELWADWTVPAVLLIAYGSPFWLALGLFRKTRARTPWPFSLGGCLVIILGALCCWIERR